MNTRLLIAAGALSLGLGLASVASAQQMQPGMQPGMDGQMQQGQMGNEDMAQRPMKKKSMKKMKSNKKMMRSKKRMNSGSGMEQGSDMNSGM
ncbi:hypothetical protein MMB17_03495 [Methylobacterium organophilum]|uniref:hypothetical protein n=1 Tax=Methylobacterium organophilum TaxID=410 RepID=UPI001F13580A|nr:hypothetical protein [Methylobacterium organophilum]UMY18416.1 hypothetical protein MMB17_03495 [Methylobacterium organophilum]